MWTWSVVAIALLTLIVGCCLFDSGDDTVSFDLCFSVLVAAVTVSLLGQLRPGGWAIPYVLLWAPIGELQVPAPPPKSTLL